MHMYRLLRPAREIVWSEAVLQGFFYSGVNFAFLFPLFYLLVSVENIGWFGLWLTILVVLFIGPVAWPYLLTLLFTSDFVANHLKIPYPSTWEYFFDQDKYFFLLIHLNDGGQIGGVWGDDSYSGSYPHEGDLYLQAVYEIKEDGTFGEPLPYTEGLLIKSGEYSHIEVFAVPSPDLSDSEENNG